MSGDNPFQVLSQPQTNLPQPALTGPKVTPEVPEPLGPPGIQALTPEGWRSDAEVQG